MHVQQLLVIAAALLPGSFAWEAGFWATDGRQIQAHGRLYNVCTNLRPNPPLRLGQVTFDTIARGIAPYPNRIQVFSGSGCNNKIYEGPHSRIGRSVSPPSLARSYRVIRLGKFLPAHSILARHCTVSSSFVADSRLVRHRN